MKMNFVHIILIFLVRAAGDGTKFCAKHFIESPPTDDVLIFTSQEFLHGSTHFSLNLLKALNHTTNSFFSPFSVWSTLVLVYMGAQGHTEKELEGLLGLSNVEKILVAHTYRAFQKWFRSRKSSHSPSFNVLNKLFVQAGVPLDPCVLEFIAQDLILVDFQNDPESARKAINAWVSANTNAKINDILPHGSVHRNTEFIIASSMYFKAPWLQPFQPQSTKAEPFFVTSKDYILVDMMNTKNTFLHAVSTELQCTAVELPYQTRSMSMVIMLPNNKAHGVNILMNTINHERLEALLDDMFPVEVIVQLPKFHIDSHYRLSSALNKMGLRDLFSHGRTNLSGFSTDRHLDIDEIYHRAFVSVEERGTEAAASTSSAVSRSSRPRKVLKFTVDRPFVFYIRENHSGAILFMGVVYNPELSPQRSKYSAGFTDNFRRKGGTSDHV